MKATRREFFAGAAAIGLLPVDGARAQAIAFTPEQFGAKGDGRTNDTDAFAALSAAVNARGGGTVVLRPVTYIVGKQGAAGSPDPGARRPMGFPPARILHFERCAGPVVSRGNGARLRCAAGLRFGSFDPLTGMATALQEGKKASRGELASPYQAMILVDSCSGPVEISDIELDGNLAALRLGGKSVKAGWQIAADGIRLLDNKGPERLLRIHSHHHAHDGLYIRGDSGRLAASTVSELTSDHNGRQGCSLVGGRNYAFQDCRFLSTGKGGLRSSPGAGVDIEPHAGRPVRNVSFSGCEFADNAGVGLIADSGDSEGARFDNCRFIGTTSWSAWPNKPAMGFTKCLFVGALVHAYGDPDPNRAAQFHDCEFRDDPALSPTREVFGGRGSQHRVAILPKNPNVLFNRCRFTLTHDLILPLSSIAVRYSDCELSQRSPVQSRLNGTFLGTNRLTGNIDLGSSVIRGEVILNGRTLARTR